MPVPPVLLASLASLRSTLLDISPTFIPIGETRQLPTDDFGSSLTLHGSLTRKSENFRLLDPWVHILLTLPVAGADRRLSS